ncbi:hypothetical protein ACUL41_07000 [Virgibacillus natechei]
MAEEETVTKEEFDAIVAERDDLLQYKPAEKTDAEVAMETKQNELWNKEVNLTLKEKGLDKFSDIVKVSNQEELESTIEALNGVVDAYKVDNAYVPTDHATEDEYEQFEQDKNVSGMISSKFKKMFG